MYVCIYIYIYMYLFISVYDYIWIHTHTLYWRSSFYPSWTHGSIMILTKHNWTAIYSTYSVFWEVQRKPQGKLSPNTRSLHTFWCSIYNYIDPNSRVLVQDLGYIISARGHTNHRDKSCFSKSNQNWCSHLTCDRELRAKKKEPPDIPLCAMAKKNQCPFLPGQKSWQCQRFRQHNWFFYMCWLPYERDPREKKDILATYFPFLATTGSSDRWNVTQNMIVAPFLLLVLISSCTAEDHRGARCSKEHSQQKIELG